MKGEEPYIEITLSPGHTVEFGDSYSRGSAVCQSAEGGGG